MSDYWRLRVLGVRLAPEDYRPVKEPTWLAGMDAACQPKLVTDRAQAKQFPTALEANLFVRRNPLRHVVVEYENVRSPKPCPPAAPS